MKTRIVIMTIMLLLMAGAFPAALGQQYAPNPSTAVVLPPESPSSELPLTELPLTESPLTELPLSESPSSESPLTESPLTESPLTELPLTELPSSSRRQVDAAVCFRIGDSQIDATFKENDSTLLRFVTNLQAILSDSNYVVTHLRVVGTSSPDGEESRNIELAGKRAESLRQYIANQTSIPFGKVEILNGGENWAGLRLMIESSDKMPYKAEMLRLMDKYADDRDARKRAMQYFAQSKPWLWMYEHFFPDLRIGAGGSQGIRELSTLSKDNWLLLRRLVERSLLPNEPKRAALDAIDQEPNAATRMTLLREVCGDSLYRYMQDHLMTDLLSTASALSDDNWTLLYRKVAADENVPDREEVLRIIDSIPAAQGRERLLQHLGGGSSYAYMKEHFFPTLLVSMARSTPEVYLGAKGSVAESTLSAENWKRLRAMIWVSDMPEKATVLEIIDATPDAVVREQTLRNLGNGGTYRYIQMVFFPELLYGISPAAQQNWERFAQQVLVSDLPEKEQILNIMQNTPSRLEREEAIRALDGGRTWERLSAQLLPELLLSTESVPMTGSGMSFYYELSPRYRQSLAEAAQLAHNRAIEPVVSQPPTPSQAAPQLPVAKKTHRPVASLKTDLMLWGGVMPGFQMGTWTPNLSAEFYFARRWSVQAGYAYSAWNALSDGKGLYCHSSGDFEVRGWLAKPNTFKGFYLGAFGSCGQYDVQENAIGQTGSFWYAGLGAGYLLPLSRHWGLEAQIRGGYRSAQNKLYDIEPGHNYFNRRETDGKFMPQVRLQVVFRIGYYK